MTHSSGFCLETLLEAAKFVEEQEQQQLQQQQEREKQIFVVASGISNPEPLIESKTGLTLLASKADTALPALCLNQGKLINSYIPEVFGNYLGRGLFKA